MSGEQRDQILGGSESLPGRGLVDEERECARCHEIILPMAPWLLGPNGGTEGSGFDRRWDWFHPGCWAALQRERS